MTSSPCAREICLQKIAKLLEEYVEDTLEQERDNYSTYKEVYDHMTKLTAFQPRAAVCPIYTQGLVDNPDTTSLYQRMSAAMPHSCELNAAVDATENVHLDICDIKTEPPNLDKPVYESLLSEEDEEDEEDEDDEDDEEDEDDEDDEEEVPEKEAEAEAEEEESEEEESEEEAEEEAEEEEVEVTELTIEGRRVYVSDEKNGDIYEILPDDDIGDVIGNIKNGKVIFY